MDAGAAKNATFFAIFAALPSVSYPNLLLEAGEMKAYSRGIGLSDVALFLAGRRVNARIFTKDMKLQTLLSYGETFDAKK